VLHYVREVLTHKVDPSIVKFLDKLSFRIVPGKGSLEVGMRRFLVPSQDAILYLIQAEVKTPNAVEERFTTIKRILFIEYY
jgi:hypothetical protein